MIEVKLPRDEISPRVERVTTYRSLLTDRFNFTPGQNLTCDGPLQLTFWNKTTSAKFSTAGVRAKQRVKP